MKKPKFKIGEVVIKNKVHKEISVIYNLHQGIIKTAEFNEPTDEWFYGFEDELHLFKEKQLIKL